MASLDGNRVPPSRWTIEPRWLPAPQSSSHSPTAGWCCALVPRVRPANGYAASAPASSTTPAQDRAAPRIPPNQRPRDPFPRSVGSRQQQQHSAKRQRRPTNVPRVQVAEGAKARAGAAMGFHPAIMPEAHPANLVELDGFEQRFEVAFPETLIALRWMISKKIGPKMFWVKICGSNRSLRRAITEDRRAFAAARCSRRGSGMWVGNCS